MKTDYLKHYSKPAELISLLSKRGLIIENEKKAEDYLTNIGYFRLSAYFYPFLAFPKSEHLFRSNCNFKQVMQLYRFDRKLRLLMFNEIEKIEIAVRSAIVNITAEETNNPFWMTSNEVFAREDMYNKMMRLLTNEYAHSHEEFIHHFKDSYSNPFPPAWQLSEILPLGVMTRVYQNIKSNQIRKKIAQRFYLHIPVFESWMTIVTLTRNSCCHHSRVWNREYAFRSRKMHRMERAWISDTIDQRRIFFNLSVIKYFLDIISPNNNLKHHLLSLFNDFPIVDKRIMGFTEDWESEPLWK